MQIRIQYNFLRKKAIKEFTERQNWHLSKLCKHSLGFYTQLLHIGKKARMCEKEVTSTRNLTHALSTSKETHE